MAIDVAARTGWHPYTRLGVPATFGAGVLAQVVYPLVDGSARDVLTVATVLLVAAAALAHALIEYGRAAFRVLVAVSVVGGFAVEVLGVHTGLPFGSYTYASTLGPSLAGVPVVIAFAWTMLAWPAALVARRLSRSFGARVVIGAWALAAWDLFLDPQMVAAGHWRWLHPAPHLPGVASVPLTDYAGWLAVSVLVSFALQRGLRATPNGNDRWPLTFYLWTWASSTLALSAFLGLGVAALWGALAMGVVAIPLIGSLAGRR